MISSVGSYAVTAFSADRANSSLVAIGCPINRLEPWPTISSGCSLAIAARTTCSTSLASRTFRVSTPSALLSLHDRHLRRPALPRPSIHSHLLKTCMPLTRPPVMNTARSAHELPATPPGDQAGRPDQQPRGLKLID